MLMSTENELRSLFSLPHKIIDLIHSPIGDGDLCLILGKNITGCFQKRVLWIIKF